jgi:uncharacterized protein (TIGR01777 family)
MNILISGGTGLIGEALIEKLLDDGHKISILTRNIEKAKAEIPAGVFAYHWNGANTDGWSQIIEEMDAVINLAGESIAGNSLAAILTRRWTTEQKNLINQSRLQSGRALSEAIQIASKKPDVFIQASAVGYYGPQHSNIITEQSPAGNDFLSKVCQSWEESSLEIEKMGVRHVIIRTGLVFATEGGILPMMLLPFRLFVGGPIGSGSQYISWIHIQDQVNAIRFLLTNRISNGAYNLTAPNPVTSREFGQIAGKVLKRPSYFPVPSFALKLALGEKATLVLDGQRVIPEKLLDEGFDFKFDSSELALQNLL